MTWLGLAVVGVVLAVQVLSTSDPSRSTPLNRLDLLLYDWRFQLLPPARDAALPIVIVDLDEATQQREGRWPWDRSKVAALLQTIHERGAALVGFDVVFSESVSNPAQQIIDAAILPPSLSRTLESAIEQFDGDAVLARALGTHTVLGYFFHADGASAGVLPFPFYELPPGTESSITLISMPDYTANLPLLADHAPSSGFVVAVPDADGIVRRMPLVMRHDAGVYASLTLEMARIALGAPWIRLQTVESGSTRVVMGVQVGQRVTIPLDAHGNMLVPYRGRAGAYTTLSATGVLRGDASPDDLAMLDGALVLVGTSALGLSDLRTTPLQTGFPGVEVHANVLDTMLQGALGAEVFYYRPDWEPGATFVILLISGLLLAFSLPGRTPPVMLSVAGAWLLIVVATNALLWHGWHLALPLALQLLMVLALALLNIAGGYLITNRQKRSIQSLFGEYVPAAYVERMVARPEQISLEGEQRDMTVLFADVRNFTALSETLSATELKDVLNRYLSAITEVIFQHHGTIDKYVGDMVMAFWNAPLDDVDHAHHAVQAALAMQARMVTLREEFKRDGLPRFHIGIGLNTGPMNVGDMGSRYRRAYTVLGDAVNLASRLEGLTDFYQVPVLVSDTTRQATPAIEFRTIDLVRVKGRQEPVEISEPVGARATLSAGRLKTMEQFERFIEHYRQQRWEAARAALNELRAGDPDNDGLYSVYATRLARSTQGDVRGQWTAVYSHETK